MHQNRPGAQSRPGHINACEAMNTTTKDQMIKSACWGNVLLGLWQVISPFVLDYRHVDAAMWNSIVVGVAVGLLALARATGFWNEAKQAETLIALLGAWLIISAFALGFS